MYRILPTLQGLLLILVPFGIYFPILEAGHIIDDNLFYLDDPLMNAADGLFRIWFSPFENNGVWPYLPITRSTFWIERQLLGVNLPVTHAINVLLHILSGCLLWELLRRWQLKGAWWVALLFVTHPIYVQSVAWIAERKNGVVLVFFLLSLRSYWQFEKVNTAKNWGWYGLALAAFVMALLSKTSAIMLPVLLVILRVWQRRSWDRGVVWQLVPFFVLAAGLGWVRIWFELNAFGAQTLSHSFSERLLVAGHVPFFYLSKLVWPYPLIFTYPSWSLDFQAIRSYVPWLSIVVSLGILGWKYQSWGRSPLFGLLAFGLSLFPVMGFFPNAWMQFSFVADHWVHLPSLPLLIVLVEGFIRLGLNIQQRVESFNNEAELAVSTKAFMCSIGGTIVCVLGGLTWNQTQIYFNHTTLWQATLKHHPESWVAYQELGREALAAKDYQKALVLSDKALSIDAQLSDALNNRGLALFHLKKYEAALQSYRQALEGNPNSTEVHNNLGLFYLHFKNVPQALTHFQDALNLNPYYADAYYNRANAYFQAKQYAAALQDYAAVIRLQPEHTRTYNNRGLLRVQLKQYEAAIDEFTQALRVAPLHPLALNNRGYTYLLQGKTKLGCRDLRQACQVGNCTTYHEMQRQQQCR